MDDYDAGFSEGEETARKSRQDEIDDLENQIDRLERRVEELEDFENDARTRIESLSEWLDDYRP